MLQSALEITNILKMFTLSAQMHRTILIDEVVHQTASSQFSLHRALAHEIVIFLFVVRNHSWRRASRAPASNGAAHHEESDP